MTQQPVAMVPVTAAYASHAGHHASLMGDVEAREDAAADGHGGGDGGVHQGLGGVLDEAVLGNGGEDFSAGGELVLGGNSIALPLRPEGGRSE